MEESTLVSDSPPAARAPRLATRRDALALAPTLAVLGLIYALTLCPTVWWYDSAEFAARASSLTLAHAPGYPSYVLLAHLFTYLGPEPAWGTNLMSAVFGLASVAAAYVLQRQLGVREAFAAVSAFALGVSQVLWANAVVTEVYTVGLCFSLATFCLLAAGQHPGRTHLVVAAAALATFGLGMHMSLATCGLGFVLLAASAGMTTDTWPELARVFTPAQWRRRLRLAGWCALGLAVGLSVYVIFPLVEFEQPFRRLTWLRWWALISAKVFQPKFVEATAKLDFPARNLGAMLMHLGWVGLGLGGLGALAALWRKPLLALALVLAALGNLWFVWNYQVHDIEVFFLPAAAITFVFAGFAVETAAELLETRFGPRARIGLSLALAGLLALWPLVSLRETWPEVDASDKTEARTYAERLIGELPPDALFVLYNHPEEWKHAAVLFYVQQALGERRDVRVITRPNLDELDELLAAGTPVFAFRNVRRVRKRVALRQEGGFVRVLRTTHELPRR